MIQAVNFGNAPSPKKEEKKSYTVPGFVVGAAAGAGVGYVGGFAKRPEYATVDEFVKADKVSEKLDAVKDESKKTDVQILKDELAAKKATDEKVSPKIEAIFGKEAKDDAEVPLSKILENTDGKDTLEQLQSAIKDDADKDLKPKEAITADVKKAAEGFDKTKDAGSIIGDQSKEGNAVTNVYRKAGDSSSVMVETGKMVKDGDKLKFEKTAEAIKLEDYEKPIVAEREALSRRKALASTLGVTADTKVDAKISKSKATEAFGHVLGEKAKTAYENVKGSLDKVLSGKALAIYIAGAAVAGALIGKLLSPKAEA